MQIFRRVREDETHGEGGVEGCAYDTVQTYATTDGRLAYVHTATPRMRAVRVGRAYTRNHACARCVARAKIPQLFTPEPEVAPLSPAPLL